MKRLASSLLILSACTTLHTPVRFDDARSSDADCGQVSSVNVRLREGVSTWPRLMTCAQARGYVEDALVTEWISSSWTVIFTSAVAGWNTNRDFRLVPLDGATYPRSRGIVVNASRPYILTHELAHASDVEHGKPNTRD